MIALIRFIFKVIRMFRLPALNSISTKTQHINGFKGLNQGLFIGSNEFSEMQNLTGDYYPVLSTRKKRRSFDLYDRNYRIVDVGGIGANEKIYYTGISLSESNPIHAHFYYDGDGESAFEVEDSFKTFVNMGNYVIIFPDKIRYHIGSGTYESLENEWTPPTEISFSVVKIRKCDSEGQGPTDKLPADKEPDTYTYVRSDSEPIDPPEDSYWLDTSETPYSMKRYMNGEWLSISLDYIRIEGTNIHKGFKEGDVVTIQGIAFLNIDINGEHVIKAVGGGDEPNAEGYIVIKTDKTFTNITATSFPSFPKISRKIPQMDFVTEKNNRLWGCSSEKHEIYASALGDPTNWQSYQGIASDSYAATIGSQGNFTGAAAVDDLVVFFKEDCLHVVRGDMPSNYTIETIYGAGLQKGSEKSLRVINEVLYYKGRDGVYAFNGLLPIKISEDLGHEIYSNASAGALGNKYYISMKDRNENWHMFVYDTKRELWHREDNACATDFTRLGGELYYLGNESLHSVNGTTEGLPVGWFGVEESDFEWYAVTGDIGIDGADNKYISKLQFRMEAERGTQIYIDVQYDRSGVWEHKYTHNPTKLRVFTVPIIPKRCDTMKIRLRGNGNFKLYSITKTIEQGSEL